MSSPTTPRYLEEFQREAVAGRAWGTVEQQIMAAFPLKIGPSLRIRGTLRLLFPWLYVNVRDLPLASSFICRLAVTINERRKRQWLRHLAMHAVVFHAASLQNLDREDSTRNAIKPKECLEFIQHHLGVLDHKNSSLLALIALMAAGMGLVISRADLRPQPSFLLVVGVLILVDVLLCVRASLRVRWGELGHSADPVESWRLHLDEMIGALITRTARFRVATLLTLVNVLLVAIYLVRAEPVLRDQTSQVMPQAPGALVFQDVVEFASGEDCGSRAIRDRLARLAEQATAARWMFVTLESSADAVPVRPQSVYGNNIGVALARADCVRDALEGAGIAGQRPTVTIRLRDASNRTQIARQRGDVRDRVVRVHVYESIEAPTMRPSPDVHSRTRDPGRGQR